MNDKLFLVFISTVVQSRDRAALGQSPSVTKLEWAAPLLSHINPGDLLVELTDKSELLPETTENGT